MTDPQHSELDQYGALAERYAAAYTAFKVMYEVRTPPPVREHVKHENLISIAALGVMVLASVVVSGSRTIPEFGGGLVGISAFVMLELGMVAYAYTRTRNHYDASRHASVQRLVNRGLFLAFIVAVSANVHHELKTFGLPPMFDGVVKLMMALSAPTLAYIAGDVVGMLVVKDAQRQRNADNAHNDALAAWRDGLNASWNAQKSRMGIEIKVSRTPDGQARVVDSVSALSVSEQTDRQTSGQTAKAGYGHTRTPDGQARVVEYLNANPDDAQLPSRKLAELIGVGHDTANKGRSLWRGQLSSAD